LQHYRYVFETLLGVQDKMSDVSQHLLIQVSKRGMGLTAKLFMQANAYGFEYVQYLIDSIGLNPNIGWPADNPTVNIVFHQKTEKDLEYLLSNQICRYRWKI
jgi:hypothetical protein